MSSSKFPLTVTLKAQRGKVIGQQTINSQTDTCTFKAVPPGRYTVSGAFADGSRTADISANFSQPTNATYFLDNLVLSAPTSTHDQPSSTVKSKPPLQLILTSSIAISLASNFGGVKPLFKEIANRLSEPQQAQSISTEGAAKSQSNPGNSQTSYRNAFSARVEAQLRTCVENNFTNFAQIPTLTKLLKAASWDREAEGEFERQLIDLYADVQQLRIAINRCDPELTQEVFAARARIEDSEASQTAFVIGEVVNVRAGPTTDSEILMQLPYGTSVLIDQETSATMLEDQRIEIGQGVGWQPILLSNNETGYIYSGYISDSL